MQKNRPVVLMILDGWGLSPSWGGNALVMNNPKNIDNLWRNYPHKILQALGAIEYGNVVGESRLGHLMIGAGRSVKSPHTRINQEIIGRTFYKNQQLAGAFAWAKQNNSNVHLIGMISNGGVHSDISHLLALLEMAHRQDFDRVFIDAITDGTDTGPTQALNFIEKIRVKMDDVKIGQFGSVCGRNTAMDRDENWDKIKKYYLALTEGNGKISDKIESAISESYRNNLTDEYIEPTLIKDKDGKINPIKAGDAVIFFNFREDRARQLAKVFLDSKFKTFFFRPKKVENLYFCGFTNYQKDLPAKVAFPDEIYANNLSEVVSKSNGKQLKIAESEKMAHVTYFLNGGQEEAYPGEERKIISSPKVASYDLKPEMSSRQITSATLSAIKSRKYDLIVLNFANVDMIAHTGNIIAVGQAVQSLDEQVGQIVKANRSVGGVTIITADHGNAEQMVNINQSDVGERETMHTLNPVPFIMVKNDAKKDLIRTSLSYGPNALSKIISATDSLADIAPTILQLLEIPKPAQMTGHSLLNRLE
ncbi:TPA: 2,3-bisphosphoglycerate-independent phosphoglycerate mutase [Candidatus Berkelbacteria bacterium]|uniref:2,3-bisphosphoglycerate-independent phosphoglycerate mutase n=1 Tax=Berkelbacteria bacterium GW2011_GWE1_39_12 TaxID=1618337 RepID=A0A0G4B5U1_9BACT|nr:MAG: phosphoglycerate mutase, 2,3-bisphosphoglycerate-independent, 2,3-bisphosphoglycerate-independent phosphoglycerate mutase [Berkelbacteria bacterium GW2011_GWE1_39_12]HBO60151.1 2,3-bisphosphoglycerate-independent phosphoglycerate mutase [Candidatus Berkelbacteria bacterium]